MASLKGSLFSLNASGSLAKTIVYGKTKGVKYAREHAIPSNPNTAAQQVVRGNMVNVITEWHNAQRIGGDVSAYNTWANRRYKRMSGWSLFVKKYLPLLNNEDSPTYFRNIVVDFESEVLTITGLCNKATEPCSIYLYSANGTFVDSFGLNTEADSSIDWEISCPLGSLGCYCQITNSLGWSGWYELVHV